MGCITRECRECGHIDGRYPPHPAERRKCPKCGATMLIEFDEWMDGPPEPPNHPSIIVPLGESEGEE